MPSIAQNFDPAKRTLRQVPSGCRLRLLKELLVAEVEQLGYDLAHRTNTDTVSAVFILARDVEDQMKRVQAKIERELECTDCPFDGLCRLH